MLHATSTGKKHNITITIDKAIRSSILDTSNDRQIEQTSTHDHNTQHSYSTLALLTCGIFAFFMICSFIEELAFKNVEGFSYSGFMTAYELLGFAVIAIIQRFLNGGRKAITSKPVAPLRSHAIVALLVWFSRGLTNLSLQYLNYPTQVILKSMKLPVVILGSVLILRKSYGSSEYISGFMLAISAALFSLGDSEVSPNFNPTGLLIVAVSLVGDALHSNMQEMVLRNIGAPESEVMLFSNGFGALIALTGVCLSGELFEAWNFFQKNQWLWFILGLRTIVVYFGVMCLVAVIKRYGAVAATSITTMRKIITILLSFVFFPKPFTSKYLFGIFVFMGGIWTKLHFQNKS